MKCPECGYTEDFIVDSEDGEVQVNGEYIDELGESHVFNSNDPCMCGSCSFEGSIEDFEDEVITDAELWDDDDLYCDEEGDPYVDLTY